jgi:uroporphyrinogen decarboxylase
MHLLEKMANSGVNAISLDSSAAGVDLQIAAETVPSNVIIMGNVNSTGVILNGSPAEVKAEVSQLLRDLDPYPNYILSTGCDLPQETPLENIQAFMETGRKHRVS